MKDRYIRKAELLAAIGLSASTVWRMEKAGRFPKRVRLGQNSVAWSRNQVEEWMDSLQPIESSLETGSIGIRPGLPG